MTGTNQTIIAGLVMRGEVRRKLNRIEFNGLLDRWKEEKYLLDSKFYIYGIDEGVWESLVEWMEQFN